jgi:hypothetical protein
MKKQTFMVLSLLAMLAAGLSAQKIASYSYASADGLAVRMEKTWAGANVSQVFSESETPAGAASRVLFEIDWKAEISAISQEIWLSNAKGALVDRPVPGKPSKALPAGSYNAAVVVNYGEWGLARFNLTGIVLKPAPAAARAAAGAKRAPSARSTLTTLKLDFNLPLVKFSKKPTPLQGLARYESVTWWAPGKRDGAGYIGRPSLFPPGVKDPHKRLKPQVGAEQWGAVKPGSYDLLLSVEFGRSGQGSEIRIPGMKLLPNFDLRVDLVLNGSAILVKGETVPPTIRFYPPGTAGKARKPAGAPGQALWSIDDPGTKTVCPPGDYDILYDYEKENRIEWRPGVRLEAGSLVELDSAPLPLKIVSFDQGSPRPEAGLRAPGDRYFASDDELLAAYQFQDRFDGSFVVARPTAPLEDGKVGAREMERSSDGEKFRTSFIIRRSRPAGETDLKPGMLVLYCVIDEYGRRGNDRWHMGLVNEMERAAGGELVLLRHNYNAKPSLIPVKRELIRIIEDPSFKFKVVGENHLRVK